jgi:STE24 endopeptidase
VIVPLLYHAVPLGDEQLRSRLAHLAESTGAMLAGFYEYKRAKKTRRANALLVGWGRKGKVLVSDTLLQNCTHSETEALVAHEIGHHVHGDLPKRCVLRIAGFLAILFVIKLAFDLDLVGDTDSSNMADFANMPVLVGIWICAGIYPDLLLRAIARRQESAADSFAWKITRDAHAFISALRKLHEQNLLDYPKSQQWRYAHPALESRIAAAEAFLAAEQPEA